MLKSCDNLAECEAIIVGKILNLTFIGEMDISPSDVAKLGNLIGQNLKAGISEGTAFLQEYAPASLIAFLVGQGIWFYRSGDYWSAVSAKVNQELEPRWQGQWGQFFLSFTEKLNLLCNFDFGESSYRYVTPILLHGGIPQQLLDSFFESVISVFLKREIRGQIQIPIEVRWLRNREKHRISLQQKVFQIENEITVLNEQIECINQLIELTEQINTLENKWHGFSKNSIPSQYREYRANLLNEINIVECEIEQISDTTDTLEQAVAQNIESENEIYSFIYLLDEYRKCETGYKKEIQKEIHLAQLKEICGNQILRLAAELWPRGLKDSYKDSLIEIQIEELKEKSFIYKQLKEKYAYVLLSCDLILQLLKYSIGTNHKIIPEIEVQQQLLKTELNNTNCQSNLDHILELSSEKSFTHPQPSSNTGSSVSSVNLIHNFKMTHRKISFISDEIRNIQIQVEKLFRGMIVPEQFFLRTDSVLKTLEELQNWQKKELDYSLAIKNCKYNHELYRIDLESSRQQIAASTDQSFDTKDLEIILAENCKKLDKLLQNRLKLKTYLQSAKMNAAKLLPSLLQRKEQLIKQQMELDQKIIELGGGDLNNGLNKLDSWLEDKTKLRKAKAKISHWRTNGALAESVYNFPLLDLHKLNNDLKIKRNKKLEQIHEVNQSLSEILPWLPNLDEPIRNFLIFGEEWAETWLIDSVELLQRTLETGAIPTDWDNKLPLRVYTGFETWWKSKCYQTNDQTISTWENQDRFQTPLLYFDFYDCVLKLRIPVQRITWQNDVLPRNAVFYIHNNDSGQQLEVQAALYLSSDTPHQIYNEKIECILPFLFAQYQVSLWLENQHIRSWYISTLSEELPFLVFNEDGKHLSNDILSKKRLWIMLPYGCSLLNDNPVVEVINNVCQKADMFLVDLKSEEILSIVGEKGTIYNFKLLQSFEPILLGGLKLNNLLVNGLVPYKEAPKALILPIESTNNSQDLFIYLQHGLSTAGEEWVINSNLVNVSNGQIEIKLFPGILGDKPCGWYSFILREPGQVGFTHDFVIFPYMELEFDSEVYWPTSDLNSIMQLTVIVPEGASLYVQPPAELINVEDDVHIIQATHKQETIEAKMDLQQANGIDNVIPLSFIVPLIKWKVIGSDEKVIINWSHNPEIWIGLWQENPELNLDIDLPFGILYLQLSMEDLYGQIITVYPDSNRVRINLLPFEDSLKDGKPIHEFFLSVYNYNRKVIKRVPIFAVRCLWEVANISWEPIDYGLGHHLKLTWDEKGKAENRILRVWCANKPWCKPFSFPIPEETNTISIDIDSIPAGKYLCQFDTEDIWATTEIELTFPVDDFNTTIINISNGKPYIEQLKIEWDSKGQAIITGKISAGKLKVKAVLAGVIDNQFIRYTGTSTASEQGNFSIIISNEKSNRYSSRKIAHWLGIEIGGYITVCTFLMLSNPASLEYHQPKEVISNDKWLNCWDVTFRALSSEYGIKVFQLTDYEKNKILEAARNRITNIPLAMKNGTISFKESFHHAVYKLKRGVICIDPNCKYRRELIPISAWYTEHHSCKSYAFNIEEVQGEVFWKWNPAKWLEKCNNNDSLRFSKFIHLYSYTQFPEVLQNLFSEDISTDEITIAKLLWTREMEILSFLGEGAKNEFKSD
ncbi:MAG: hypothetical protein PHO25_03955 [Syntrophomonadaceae bacterium]|nr:hypothetical protein [Syntrophomonadaceae bacterium]